MLIGFLVPGGGHIYAGSLGSAFGIWFGLFFFIWMAVVFHPSLVSLVPIILYIIFIWDAGRQAERYNTEHFPGAQQTG